MQPAWGRGFTLLYVAEKARKHLAEREAEFSEARKHWIEETTEMKMNLSKRMNEMQASFSKSWIEWDSIGLRPI